MKQLMIQDTNLKVAADMCVHASKMIEMLIPLQDLEGFSISVTRAEKPAEPVATGLDKERPSEKKRKIKIVD